MPLDDYRYLWDGSEPDWVLHRFDRVEWSITVAFADSGPTQAEVLALRRLVDEFREASLSEVYVQLKSRSEFTLHRELGNIEMREFVDAARELGLNARATSIDRGGYLPVSAAGHALIIENVELSAQVAERMIAAGVRVVDVHVD